MLIEAFVDIIIKIKLLKQIKSMQKILSLILILFLKISLSYCQLPDSPYQKMVLLDMKPDWYETTFDSSMIGPKCDGYNGFLKLKNYPAPIYKDSALYTISNISYEGKNWGYLVEKRALNTGKLKWQKRYDYTNLSRQEIPRLIRIFGNKLIVVSQSKINPPKSGDPFFIFDEKTHMFLRKFDLETGEELESYTPDVNDNSVVTMPCGYDKSAVYSNIFYTNDENIYTYTERLKTSKNDVIVTMSVNQRGQAITKRDTIKLATTTYSVAHNLEQYNADTLFYVDGHNNKIILNIYDTKFKLIKSVPFQITSAKIDAVNVDYIAKDYIILSNTYVVTINPYKGGTDYLAYDYTGKLLHKIALSNENINTKSACYFPKYKKFLLFGQVYNSDYSKEQLRVLVAKSGVKYDSLKTFDIQFPKRANPQFVYPIGENKILICFQENALYLDENTQQIFQVIYSDAESQMLIDIKNLIQTSSINNISKEKEIKLYPNPAANFISLAELSKDEKIDVYNGNGEKCITLSHHNGRLDVSMLPSGLYILKSNRFVAKFIKQ
jgi:Secretion system C-terminal sorting domain